MVMMMLVAVSVVVMVIMIVRFGRFAGFLVSLDHDLQTHTGEVKTFRAFGDQVKRSEREGGERGLEFIERHTEFDQRAEHHVAAGPADALEVQVAHADVSSQVRLMIAAAMPAPNPLSMLTTLTPAAQEFSMASNAAMPPRFTP